MNSGFKSKNLNEYEIEFEKSGQDRFLNYIEEKTQIYFTISKGMQIGKEDVVKFANKKGILVNIADAEDDMLKTLLSNGVTYLDIYEEFKDIAYGIHPSRFSNKFNINNYQRKKMEDTGFIEIAYKKAEKIMPGIYGAVPYYNPQWYFNLSIEDIERWRYRNLRGYKEKQMEMDV